MTIPTGVECYSVGCGPVVACGLTYNEAELTLALDGAVASIIRDDTGDRFLYELLNGIATTDFQRENVDRILTTKRVPEDWRVGEAIAEGYLVEYRACSFPWPAGRDQRNPDSSPAGADLVGFQFTDEEPNQHRFAFGEVKTSSEERWPPQVVNGRHGLVKQLESLRDSLKVKDHLMLYLGHRAPGSDWQHKYEEATSRYLHNPQDVSLFGVLVRDVEPKDGDLRDRAATLADGCPDTTSIELTAIYLPGKSISGIGRRIRLGRDEW